MKDSVGVGGLEAGIRLAREWQVNVRVAMTTAQRELSTALRDLSDSRGAVAQIEAANNRLTYSLDNRAKAVDALLREVRSDLLRSGFPSSPVGRS